jgi:outer membrane protein, multidrug efflux system
MKNLIAILTVALLAGCSVGPNYQRPEMETPQEWSVRDTTTIVSDSMAVTVADTAWWELFGDTVLTELITTSLTENNDIRIAAARVEQYMGYYGVTKSDFFPKIDASGSGQRGQLLTSGDGSQTRPTSNLFDVNVGARWEIDLWGKIRRATEAAKADLFASEEARRGVVLSVTALVADSYIDLLSADEQLDVARRTAASREGSVKIFRERLEKGDASELELSQAEAQYWQAVSQVSTLEREVSATENLISVLLGRPPGPIPRGSTLERLELPVVPGGLPSELLERRPDVRLAEEQLIAANARIGVAKSLYFPSISLTGLFGVASTDLSNLFTSTGTIWNVGGSVLQPIFYWGEISGQVQAAEAYQRQTLYAYVGSVQNAFRDAEDALVGRVTTQAERDAQVSQVKALRTYERLARMRYEEGVTSYLEVLDAERQLFSGELQLAQTEARVRKSIVGVFRAMGGGWLDKASQAAANAEEPVSERE